MPTTLHGLRYPSPTDPPDIPSDMQELAEDVDSLVFPRFVKVSGALPRNNTAVLSNDPDLVIALAAGATYRIYANVGFTCANAAADASVGWAYTGTMANWSRTCIGLEISTANVSSSLMQAKMLNTPAGNGYGVPTANVAAVFEDVLVQTTTAGTLSLQWAQATATAVDLSRSSMSRLAWQRLF